MTLDQEFNAAKIEKVADEMNVGYNPKDNSVRISGDVNVNFVTVNLNQQPNKPDEVDERLGILFGQVKGYYLIHPQELSKLGSTTYLALINATTTATVNNIVFIAQGTGDINI